MRTVLIGLLLIACAGCASHKPTFPGGGSDDPTTVHVLLINDQTSLPIGIDSQRIGTAAGFLTFGLAGALAGTVVDKVSDKNRTEKAYYRARTIRAALPNVDLADNYQQIIDPKREGKDWTVDSIELIGPDRSIKRAVRQVYRRGSPDMVVVLFGVFYMSPDVDRLNLAVEQVTYPREKVDRFGNQLVGSRRMLHYQSQVHALKRRELEPGEKTRIRLGIEKAYKDAVREDPENTYMLGYYKRKEIAALENATEIPEATAIAETWSSELLARYLDESLDHMRHLILLDWNGAGDFQYARSNAEKIRTKSETRKLDKFSGTKVGSYNTHSIYRHKDGHWVSLHVPDENMAD